MENRNVPAWLLATKDKETCAVTGLPVAGIYWTPKLVVAAGLRLRGKPGASQERHLRCSRYGNSCDGDGGMGRVFDGNGRSDWLADIGRSDDAVPPDDILVVAVPAVTVTCSDWLCPGVTVASAASAVAIKGRLFIGLPLRPRAQSKPEVYL